MKPKKNDPSIEIIKLLSMNNLKKVPRKEAKRMYIENFIFTYKKIE